MQCKQTADLTFILQNKMEDVKKVYMELIKDLAPLKIPRPPKPEKKEEPPKAEAAKEPENKPASEAPVSAPVAEVSA